MNQPIPWDEWESQARRLHRALAQRTGNAPCLSEAKDLVARMLGHAHWHDIERRLASARSGAIDTPSARPRGRVADDTAPAAP